MSSRGPDRRRAWSGVRGRAVLAAVSVVAVGLVVGGSLLLYLLNRTLVASVDASALARAGAVARTLGASGPDGVRRDLVVNAPVGQVVQVIDGTDRVVASSSARSATTPLSGLRPAPGEVSRSEVERTQLLELDTPSLFLAEGVQYGGRPYTVVVASSIEPARQSVRTVLGLLVVSAPVLLALVAVATGRLVGRALAPVERIRTRVAGIGGARLDERVPVPRSRDEIARLAVTMNRMLDRLQRSHTVQRQFVADASHELRSPLTTLVAALEVAGAEAPGDAWPELRETMTLETSRMGRLVDDLLLLARADDEGLRLRSEDVDMDDLVAEEAARLRVSGRIRVRSAPGPARVRGDEARIGQLVRNLCDNAVRHARSLVSLGCGSDETGCWLVVEDDGPGVPVADRGRVFDRFIRLEDSRDRGSGGSGLGLAIVREIVRAHGGTVAIDTSPLGGARVTVRFPGPGDVAPGPVREPAHDAAGGSSREIR